jgi:hypothetical protein
VLLLCGHGQRVPARFDTDRLITPVSPPPNTQQVVRMHALMSNELIRRLTWVLLVSALVGPSCSDSDPPLGDDCFPWDPWVDEHAAAAAYAQSEDFQHDEHRRMLLQIGFCEYGPEEIRRIFPEYEDFPVDFAGYCLEAESCEQCVGEEIDELIREAYSDLQDRDECPAEPRAILAYERGCMTFVEDADRGPLCCYSAAMVSECPLNSIPTD